MCSDKSITSHKYYSEWHLSFPEQGWACQTVNLLRKAEKTCEAGDSHLWTDSLSQLCLFAHMSSLSPFLYIYIYILQLLYTTPGKPNVQLHKQLLSARHWFDRWLNVPGTFPTILIFVYIHAHAYTKSRKHSFQKMKLINYLTKLFNGMLHGAGDIWFSFLIICVRRKKKRGAPQTVIHFSSWGTILSALVYFVQPW